MRIIREIEPLPWLCGIPEVLNWRQQLEYTDVYSIHPRCLPFKAVENHGKSHICRGWYLFLYGVFLQKSPGQIQSGRLVESPVSNFWAQHGAPWCPARPRTFATSLPKQQRSLADLDLSSFWERCGVEFASPQPPDASRCLQMPPVLKYVKSPFCNGYVNIGQIYKWWISKNIGFSRSMGTDPLEVQEHLLRSGIMYYLFLCKKIEALKI